MCSAGEKELLLLRHALLHGAFELVHALRTRRHKLRNTKQHTGPLKVLNEESRSTPRQWGSSMHAAGDGKHTRARGRMTQKRRAGPQIARTGAESSPAAPASCSGPNPSRESMRSARRLRTKSPGTCVQTHATHRLLEPRALMRSNSTNTNGFSGQGDSKRNTHPASGGAGRCSAGQLGALGTGRHCTPVSQHDSVAMNKRVSKN